MEYRIKVTSLDNRVSWKKVISEDEYRQCKTHSEANRFTIPGIEPLIYPVRTNSIKNFAKDFLFPSLTNLAINVQSFALRVLAAIVALPIDVVTLPLRVITALPMAFFNVCRSEQPLRKYLKEQKVDPHLYESESVKVTLTETEKNADALVKQTRFKGFVNFIQVPWNPPYGPLSENKRTSVKVGDAWQTNVECIP